MKPATQAGAAVRGPYRAPAGASVIRRMRVVSGLTQQQAASRARVSLRTFQRAESGDVVPMHVRREIERAMGAGW